MDGCSESFSNAINQLEKLKEYFSFLEIPFVFVSLYFSFFQAHLVYCSLQFAWFIMYYEIFMKNNFSLRILWMLSILCLHELLESSFDLSPFFNNNEKEDGYADISRKTSKRWVTHPPNSCCSSGKVDGCFSYDSANKTAIFLFSFFLNKKEVPKYKYGYVHVITYYFCVFHDSEKSLSRHATPTWRQNYAIRAYKDLTPPFWRSARTRSQIRRQTLLLFFLLFRIAMKFDVTKRL